MRGTSDPAGAEENGRHAAARVGPPLLVAGGLLLLGAIVLGLLRDEVSGGGLIAAVMLAEAVTLLALGRHERPFAPLPAGARLSPAAPAPGRRLSMRRELVCGSNIRRASNVLSISPSRRRITGASCWPKTVLSRALPRLTKSSSPTSSRSLESAWLIAG